MSKSRISATVDADLIRAAEQAVRGGQAATLSAWLNDAMRLKLEHELRLSALAEFVAAHEAQHGEITPAEIRDAERRTRSRALVSRAPAPRRAAGGRRG